jgi:hypothetical protein
MKHFPKKELACAVAFVVMLAGLYVGSYYAMVQSNGTPEHRFGGVTAEANFAPWHQVDRRIRPEFWQSKPLPPPPPILGVAGLGSDAHRPVGDFFKPCAAMGTNRQRDVLDVSRVAVLPFGRGGFKIPGSGRF